MRRYKIDWRSLAILIIAFPCMWFICSMIGNHLVAVFLTCEKVGIDTYILAAIVWLFFNGYFVVWCFVECFVRNSDVGYCGEIKNCFKEINYIPKAKVIR